MYDRNIISKIEALRQFMTALNALISLIVYLRISGVFLSFPHGG